MKDIEIDCLTEEEFMEKFPLEYMYCQLALTGKDIYFGSCFQAFNEYQHGEIDVYYLYEDNEDMTATFQFTKDHQLITMNLEELD